MNRSAGCLIVRQTNTSELSGAKNASEPPPVAFAAAEFELPSANQRLKSHRPRFLPKVASTHDLRERSVRTSGLGLPKRNSGQSIKCAIPESFYTQMPSLVTDPDLGGGIEWVSQCITTA